MLATSSSHAPAQAGPMGGGVGSQPGAGAGPRVLLKPRQSAIASTRLRFFASFGIKEPTKIDEVNFQFIAAAALGVPAASKDGRMLGDDLPSIFDRKGSHFRNRKYPAATDANE